MAGWRLIFNIMVEINQFFFLLQALQFIQFRKQIPPVPVVLFVPNSLFLDLLPKTFFNQTPWDSTQSVYFYLDTKLAPE